MVVLPEGEDVVGSVLPLPQYRSARRLADVILVVLVGRRKLVLWLIGPVGRCRDANAEVGLDLQSLDGLQCGVSLCFDEMALCLVLSTAVVHQCHGVRLALLPRNGIVVVAVVVVHRQEGRGLEHVADVVAVVVSHVDAAVLGVGVGGTLSEGKNVETARRADEHMVGVHAGRVTCKVWLARLAEYAVLVGV